MSRLHFHTPTGGAELLGAERHWLRHLATRAAWGAWDLDVERAEKLLSLVPESPGGRSGANYLHEELRRAKTERGFLTIQKLLNSLRVVLGAAGDLDLVLHGVRISAIDIGYNTALVVGSDPIALAAKFSGWQEVHCWVDGPDRAWCADVIQQGLNAGIYRANAGWESPQPHCYGPGVIPMLRERDDEPVVLSSSVSDQFPNVGLTDMAREDWSALPNGRRWDLAMGGLRARRPWAQITPDNLREQMFSWPITVFDLFDDARGDYVREALQDAPGYQPDQQVAEDAQSSL